MGLCDTIGKLGCPSGFLRMGMPQAVRAELMGTSPYDTGSINTRGEYYLSHLQIRDSSFLLISEARVKSQAARV